MLWRYRPAGSWFLSCLIFTAAALVAMRTWASPPTAEHAAPTPPPPAASPSAGPSNAGPTPGAPHYVSPPALPTEVGIGLFLVGLVDVSEPNEAFTTFTAELLMDVEWHDPRLKFEGEGEGERHVYLEHEAERELEEIWWPDVSFENAQGERHVENRELVIHADGRVRYSERFRGTFSAPMDLQRFPFDQQRLDVRVESFAWDERHVRFSPLPERTGMREGQETLEWFVDSVDSRVVSRPEVRSSEAFSEFALGVEVSRKPGYYLYKIVLPMMLIVAFNWATFWMPGEPASVRMERGVIALLTVVAFHQVVASNLPRIGYLTFMDGVVYIAFASVGATMIATIWAHRQEMMDRHDRVAALDWWGRWLYPIVFSLALLGLWLAYH